MAAPTTPALEILRPNECFAYLRAERVGRVALSVDALPTVLRVDYVLDGKDIVFRASADPRLSAATSTTVVAFQADGCDVAHHAAWSIVAQGVASAVVDPVELAKVERVLVPDDSRCTRVVRIRTGNISGIRMATPAADLDGGRWIASLPDGPQLATSPKAATR